MGGNPWTGAAGPEPPPPQIEDPSGPAGTGLGMDGDPQTGPGAPPPPPAGPGDPPGSEGRGQTPPPNPGFRREGPLKGFFFGGAHPPGDVYKPPPVGSSPRRPPNPGAGGDLLSLLFFFFVHLYLINNNNNIDCGNGSGRAEPGALRGGGRSVRVSPLPLPWEAPRVHRRQRKWAGPGLSPLTQPCPYMGRREREGLFREPPPALPGPGRDTRDFRDPPGRPRHPGDSPPPPYAGFSTPIPTVLHRSRHPPLPEISGAPQIPGTTPPVPVIPGAPKIPGPPLTPPEGGS